MSKVPLKMFCLTFVCTNLVKIHFKWFRTTYNIKKVSLRIRLNYSRNTISYHRKILSQKINIDLKKLSRYEYFKEMERSKVIISPFGFGEISLRDYEGFLAGGILLKPSVKHMITWPNFYKENKYKMILLWLCRRVGKMIMKFFPSLIFSNFQKRDKQFRTLALIRCT